MYRKSRAFGAIPSNGPWRRDSWVYPYLRERIRNGIHPDGVTDIYLPVNHEFGHLIDAMLRQGPERDRLGKSVRRPFSTRSGLISLSLAPSKQGMIDEDELLAEAFVALHLQPESSWSPAMDDFAEALALALTRIRKARRR